MTADPNLFFPDENAPRAKAHLLYDEARRICSGCPVQTECLDFVMRKAYTSGLWSGLSPGQIKALRKMRRPHQMTWKQVAEKLFSLK